MIALTVMMLYIVDLFFLPVVCISGMFLSTDSFWIFFIVSYPFDTIFIMNISLRLFRISSFDSVALCSDFFAVPPHCIGNFLSSSTLLNIAVRLSVISLISFFSLMTYLEISCFPFLRVTFLHLVVLFFFFQLSNRL